MRVQLETVNKWMRRVGLLLVVCIDDDDGPTFFKVIRARSYRCGGAAK